MHARVVRLEDRRELPSWRRVIIVLGVWLSAAPIVAQPPPCTNGLDPMTSLPWVVCAADTSTAWVSCGSGAAGSCGGGGVYTPLAICESLGYSTVTQFGGNCGNVCGRCEGTTSCSLPGTRFFDGAGTSCGSGTLCNTVMWECGGFVGCGDGSVGPGEQCDDGNTVDGDCCSSTCQFEASGTPCLDATVCNGDETCDGAGTCAPGTPLNCDDNNACTADSCDVESGCANVSTPSAGCLTAAKSILLIKNAVDDAKDKLLWKWLKGAAATQPTLGDPTATAEYALCVYAGPGNTPVAAASLPPGSSWIALGTKGYKFKGASPNGLSFALIKGGDAGKSKALAKGKGSTLPDPPLPLAYPVTVQLKKDGSPLCLESVFVVGNEKKNTEAQFKAKQ